MSQNFTNFSTTESIMNDEPKTPEKKEEEEKLDYECKELDNDMISELKSEAITLKEYFEKFDKDFFDENIEYFYIISKAWLKKWEKHVCYEDIIANKNPNTKKLGQIKLDEMNLDIIEDSLSNLKYVDDDHYANVYLKPTIQENIDYKIITEEAWEYLNARYQGLQIKRPAYTLPNGERRVEIMLKQFKVVIISSPLLMGIDNNRIDELKSYKFQVYSKMLLKDLKVEILRILNSATGHDILNSINKANNFGYYSSASSSTTITSDYCRLWKLDPSITLDNAFKYLRDICKTTPSYDYRIPFKGNFLEKDDDNIKFEELNIAEDDHLVIELREYSKGWHFTSDDVPALDKCEFCSKYDLLKYPCVCKKVNYCSIECKAKDKRYHSSRCEREEEEEEEFTETPESRWGRCGLQNLGNTCFMNSGLQCLSHIKELTLYFLSNKYKNEINETNPLGTKGKLAKKYANLIKNLHYGTSQLFSPWGLKQAVGQFQSMFIGYQQHDSQELISFILDGLHEDLNRVQQKPTTAAIESNGQPDHEVAKESWKNHLKRNKSIIVDLLFGQFKSTLMCPSCKKISITFDPFHSIPVPIPLKKEKELEFFYIHSDYHKKPYRVSIKFPVFIDHYMSQFKSTVANLLNKDPKRFDFVFLTNSSKELVTDEDSTLANTIRKRRKRKNLFAIEISNEDYAYDMNDRLDVNMHLTKSYGGTGSLVRNVTFIRPLIILKTMSFKDVYFKVFKFLRFLYDEYMPEHERSSFLKLNDHEAFEKIYEEADHKPFKIKLVTNSKSYEECYFCNEYRCENCELAYRDDMFIDKDILPKIKNDDFKLELEIYLENLPEYIELARFNSCVDFNKNQIHNNNNSSNNNNNNNQTFEEHKGDTSNVTIYDCLAQFAVPEILGEDNKWYCNRCKEFQKATKKMEIYKAPPILMIQLKRFRHSSNFKGKSKIEEVIDFPLNDLDLTDYVKNPELPMDYVLNEPEDNKQESNEQAQQSPDTTKSSSMEIEEESKEICKMELEIVNKSDKAKSDSGNPKRLLYDLFAVSNHYGGLGGGHYTAYSKNFKTGQWYSFDDSYIREESSDSVCSRASYVLFYRRKDFSL